MKICLKTYARQSGSQHVLINVQNRLPDRVNPPCELACEFQVEAHADYYLLTLNVHGTLAMTCQRCLGGFQHDYYNQIKLAVCTNDTIAETLMARYDCTVASNSEIDLTDILTDELHLFSPEKHRDPGECDHDVNALISRCN